MLHKSRHWYCVALTSVSIVIATNSPATQNDGGEQAIKDVTWEWTETVTPNRRIRVEQPERYTLRLKGNGEAQLRYDCNHGGSYYEISGDKIAFGPLTATRIPCKSGSRGVIYMLQLDVAVSYFTRDGYLFLVLPEQSGTMRFRRAGSE